MNNKNAFAPTRRHMGARDEVAENCRHMRCDEKGRSFQSFYLFCSMKSSSVAISVSSGVVALPHRHDLSSIVRLTLRDENHKKLKAGGENNIIRDYFHSSDGFSLFSKSNKKRLSLDYRFFRSPAWACFCVPLLSFLSQASLCAAAAVCFFLCVVGSRVYTDHVPVDEEKKLFASSIPRRISGSWIFKIVSLGAPFFWKMFSAVSSGPALYKAHAKERK